MAKISSKKADPTLVSGPITIQALSSRTATFRIIGTQPMLQNRMANKVIGGLLVGTHKKTRAERVEIKHDPLAEFRSAVEMMHDGPTALGLKVVAVKSAMCTAALETAGITKTSAQRLLFMPGEKVPLYGIPQLRMDVVRSADINHTPDVRTRPFLPKWGAEIEITYIVPQLSAVSVTTLLYNAGIIVGIGDGRQEKGKMAFRSFRVLRDGEDEKLWDDLVKHHGRKAQEKALKNPEYADDDTRDLMEFFFAETQRRAA